MKKTRRGIPDKRSSLLPLLGVVLVVLALFLLKDSIFHNKKNLPPEGEAGKALSGTGVDTGPKATAPAPPTPAAPAETPPSPPAEVAKKPAVSPCQQTSDDLRHFIKQLEGKPYIKAYAIDGPLQAHLEAVLARLLDTPPVNANETADLLTILKNNAHIYRTIGLKDLSLLKDILSNEHEAIEPLFANLYAWSTMDRNCHEKSDLKLQLPLAKTYEYAAFFLNTLGGKSYLSRRDPIIRVLIRYYSVLIVQQAVKHSANRYDLDLYYHLKAVGKEIKDSAFLEDQEQYLDTINRLRTGH